MVLKCGLLSAILAVLLGVAPGTTLGLVLCRLGGIPLQVQERLKPSSATLNPSVRSPGCVPPSWLDKARRQRP